MGKGYATIAFTPAVQAEQDRIGSRGRFAEMERAGRDDRRVAIRRCRDGRARGG